MKTYLLQLLLGCFGPTFTLLWVYVGPSWDYVGANLVLAGVLVVLLVVPVSVLVVLEVVVLLRLLRLLMLLVLFFAVRLAIYASMFRLLLCCSYCECMNS